MRWIRFLPALALLLLPGLSAAQQAGRITGTVTEAGTSRPLAGAQVAVVGTSQGAVTGADGRYTVTGVQPGTRRLRATAVGRTAQEVTVAVRAGEVATANFQLGLEVVQLEGIVAIGYGTQRRRDLTGSVASVSQEEIAQVPTADVREALRGKVPGLDVSGASGSPNSGVDLTLRGTRSLIASNDPLVIVDGNQFGNLRDLNPNDIESIQVLKDASSTAIYGSRGANGVIIVTTKSGAGSETSISVNSYAGITDVTSYPRINTGPEYVAQKREASRTTGLWKSPADDAKIFNATELENIRNGVWTDFRDLLFRRGFAQSHQVGVTTGTENTKAYLSAGVYNEQGTLRLDDLTRYTLRLNMERALGDQWKVGTNSQVTYYDTNERQNPFNIANKINPLTPAYDEEGKLIIYPNGGKDISPLADEQPNAYADNTLRTNIIPSLYAEFSPSDALTVRSTLSAELNSWRNGFYASPATIAQNGAASVARMESAHNRDISFENVATYKRDTGDHSIGLTGITSYIASQQDFASASGRNQLLSSQLFYGLGNANEGLAISSGYEESSLMSLAGRVNYGFRDRYLLTLTGRFDGSSRLSPSQQWAFFPSVAAAWRVSDEPFLRDNALVSDMKLRLSYGVSGNDAVDPYSTQATLIRIPFSFGEKAAPGYAFSSRVGNEDLKWELSATTNLGLDVALWDNRVTATMDVYQTNTSNLLLQRFLPLSSGVSSVMQNIGRTRNRGIELSINTINVETDDLSWQSGLTFFSNREEIVELVGGTNDIGNGWFIGYPAEVFYDYDKIGIWQQNQAEEAKKFGQVPGDIRVRDVNGDGKITASGDRVVLGSPRPAWSGSLRNTATFRNLDLGATIFARMGQEMEYEYNELYKPDGVENGAFVDYWTPENPTNAFPRPNTKRNFRNYPYFSSLFYENGSFVKLSEATLGYTLPSSLTGRLRSDRIRLYVTGKNLGTWSRVENYDPERGGALSFPMTRMIVAGVDVGF